LPDNEVGHLNRIMKKVQRKYSGKNVERYKTSSDIANNIARLCSNETGLEEDIKTADAVDKALLSGHSIELVTSIVIDTTPENHKKMISKLKRLSMLKQL
jgi:hypothetical protein